jgi:hypothetical protein
VNPYGDFTAYNKPLPTARYGLQLDNGPINAEAENGFFGSYTRAIQTLQDLLGLQMAIACKSSTSPYRNDKIHFSKRVASRDAPAQTSTDTERAEWDPKGLSTASCRVDPLLMTDGSTRLGPNGIEMGDCVAVNATMSACLITKTKQLVFMLEINQVHRVRTAPRLMALRQDDLVAFSQDDFLNLSQSSTLTKDSNDNDEWDGAVQVVTPDLDRIMEEAEQAVVCGKRSMESESPLKHARPRFLLLPTPPQ